MYFVTHIILWQLGRIGHCLVVRMVLKEKAF